MENLDEIRNKAKSFIELKEYKKAIELLYKILSCNPNNEEILLQVAQTFSKMNNFERAKDYYLKIIELNPFSKSAFGGLAKLYKKHKKFKKALEYIDKSLEVQVTNEDVEFKAHLLLKLNKPKEALDILNELINKIAKTTPILNSIALCNLKLENYEIAIEYYNKSIEMEDNNSAKLGLAKIYLQLDLQKAKDILESLIQDDFNDIKAHYLLAEVFYKDKKYEKAIAQYNLILSIKKNDILALNKLGVTYSEIGWHDEAVKVYNEILKIIPYDKEIKYALAYTYFINDEYNKAQKVLLDNCEYIKSKILLAQIAFNEDRYSKCIEILSEVLKEDENNKQAVELLAKAYETMELKDLALKYYEHSLCLGSDDINTMFKAGVFLKEKGEIKKAKSLFNKVLDIDKNHIDANLNLAEILYEYKNYNEVLVILDKLIQRNKNIVEIYPLGAKASLAIDNLDLARNFLYESIKKNPSNPESYYLTGIFMERLNEPDEAETFYEEAVSLDEHNIIYLNAFANYYFKYNDFENALKYYKKSLNKVIDEDIEVKMLNCFVELKQKDKLKKYLKKAKSKKLDALFSVHK